MSSVFIRVLDPRHYIVGQSRYSSLAFRPSSSDGGISVFCERCAIETSESICRHIDIFYAKISGNPAKYWAIDTQWLKDSLDEDLKDQVEFEHLPTQDPCHYNIINFPKNGKASGKIIKKAWESANEGFFVCNGEESVPVFET